MYIYLIVSYTIQIDQTEAKITCALSESDANFPLNIQLLFAEIHLNSSNSDICTISRSIQISICNLLFCTAVDVCTVSTNDLLSHGMLIGILL